MKSKELKVGDVVMLTKTPRKHSWKANSGVALKVKALDFPFAVVSVWVPARPAQSMGPLMTPPMEERVETVSLNVKGCRFHRVSEEFLIALGHRHGEPDWLHDADKPILPVGDERI